MNIENTSKNADTKPDGYTVLADAVFRPILFSTPMVQAILDGRKTQTRRVIKDETLQLNKNEFEEEEFLLATLINKINKGDILWVRETFQPIDHPDLKYRYKADHFNGKSVSWKPSIFMPKEACRIFLEVTNVRVERLQDISEEDAVREGVEIIHLAETHVPIYRNYLIKEKLGTTNPKKSFQSLWQSINGKDSWNKNPWVWVYEFKRIERPSGFC